MNTPLVSVLMTVYNREKYIAEAIESVMASTYQNWELIIVDDQSKDRSVEIAREYEKKDSRIKLYINEVNLGDYPNRNRAASHAKGKYLKYVDADDMIYPHCLGVMIDAMEKFPEAGYGLSMVEQDFNYPYPIILSPQETYFRHYFISPVFHKSPLGAIIRRSSFDIVNGFTSNQHIGDFEMWHSLSSIFDVILITGGLSWYRSHDDQQMNDNRTDDFVPFKYLLSSYNFLADDVCPLIAKHKEEVCKKIRKRITRSFLRQILKGNVNNVKKMVNVLPFPFIQLLKNI